MSASNRTSRFRLLTTVGVGIVAAFTGAALNHFGQRATSSTTVAEEPVVIAEEQPAGVFAQVTQTEPALDANAAGIGGLLPDLSGLFDSDILENAKAVANGETPAVDPFEDLPEPTADETAATGGTPIAADDIAFTDAFSVGDIHVTDAPIDQVLRMLAEQTQMNIIAHDGVVGNITANLYGVTVEEALEAILESHGFGYRNDGNFIHVYTADALAQLEVEDAPTETRVFRVFHIEAEEAEKLIKPVLGPNAIVAVSSAPETGISSGDGGSDTGGFNYSNDELIVVTDTVASLDNVRRLLDDIDRRPAQILIEATILRATLTEDNALGVDFN
ncbi:MAG: secretin N-terminal domain-containing protein, partial [Planctomycetota bacterium]